MTVAVGVVPSSPSLPPGERKERMTRWRRRKTSCTHPDSSVSSFVLSFWVGGENQEEEEAINNQLSAQKCVLLFGRNCPSPVPSPW